MSMSISSFTIACRLSGIADTHRSGNLATLRNMVCRPRLGHEGDVLFCAHSGRVISAHTHKSVDSFTALANPPQVEALHSRGSSSLGRKRLLVSELCSLSANAYGVRGEASQEAV